AMSGTRLASALAETESKVPSPGSTTWLDCAEAVPARHRPSAAAMAINGSRRWEVACLRMWNSIGRAGRNACCDRVGTGLLTESEQESRTPARARARWAGGQGARVILS